VKIFRIILILCLSITMTSCLDILDNDSYDEPYIPSVIHLAIMDIDGNNIQYIANEYNNYDKLMSEDAHFTPDGKYLTNGRHIMNLDGSGYKQLVPDSLEIYSYCFDSSSNYMYFSTLKNAIYYIYKKDINNDNIALIHYSTNPLGRISLSLNEDKLATPKYGQINYYDLTTNQLVNLTAQDQVFPNGNVIFAKSDTEIYFGTNQGLYSININTKEIIPIAPRGSLELRNQDASRFVYETGTYNIEMLELNNGTYNYSIINNVKAYSPSINKAGDKVLYTSDYAYIIVNCLDSNRENIIRQEKGLIKTIMSPTGEKVLLYTNIQAGSVTIGKNYGVGL